MLPPPCPTRWTRTDACDNGKVLHTSTARPRRGVVATHSLLLSWLAVGIVLLAAQCWALYTPSSPTTATHTYGWLRGILAFLPDQLPEGDKIIHATSFAAVTAAFLLARIPWGWVVSAGVIHAVVSEYVQYLWVPGRSGDWKDCVFDVIGIIVASIVIVVSTRHDPASSLHAWALTSVRNTVVDPAQRGQ